MIFSRKASLLEIVHWVVSPFPPKMSPSVICELGMSLRKHTFQMYLHSKPTFNHLEEWTIFKISQQPSKIYIFRDLAMLSLVELKHLCKAIESPVYLF